MELFNNQNGFLLNNKRNTLLNININNNPNPTLHNIFICMYVCIHVKHTAHKKEETIQTHSLISLSYQIINVLSDSLIYFVLNFIYY
jgi:hypothetical protein